LRLVYIFDQYLSIVKVDDEIKKLNLSKLSANKIEDLKSQILAFPPKYTIATLNYFLDMDQDEHTIKFLSDVRFKPYMVNILKIGKYLLIDEENE